MAERLTTTIDDAGERHTTREMSLSAAEIAVARILTILADASTSFILNYLFTSPQESVRLVLGTLFGIIYGNATEPINEKLLMNEEMSNRLKWEIWLLLRLANVNMQATFLELTSIITAPNMLTALSSAALGINEESFVGQIVTIALQIHRVIGLISYIGFVMPTLTETAVKTYRLTEGIIEGSMDAFAKLRSALLGKKQLKS